MDHCLGFVREIHHRVVINGEGVQRVAYQCDQSETAFESIVRILEHCKGCPSDERLACIAMNDPTLNDEDIGDIFGRTTLWAGEVRDRRAAHESAEPIPESLCWFKGHITTSDLMPEEIRHRCAKVQAMSVMRTMGRCQKEPGIRHVIGGLRNGSLVFRSIG